MSDSTKRPRRDCEVCGRGRVAVMADGSLWWHKWPGWALWSDGGDCKGPVDSRPGYARIRAEDSPATIERKIADAFAPVAALRKAGLR